MATYNGERYVREQILSIQNQSFQDWRLLISDDCSSDRTLKIIQQIAAKDSRISIVSHDTRYGSAKANFMNLIKAATAPYIMFCDQDDVWLPNKITKTYLQMCKLESKYGIDVPFLVFTDMKVVNENLSIISNSFEKYSNINPKRTRFPQLIAQSVGAGCTMMINRKLAEYACKVEKIDDIIMHDWWLSLIASAFGKIAFINESTSLYRQHDDNEVGAQAYSPLKKMRQLELMRKSMRNTVNQAYIFNKSYLIKNNQYKNNIYHFILSFKTHGIVALWHLIMSRCWKQGLRKIGQIFVVLTN